MTNPHPTPACTLVIFGAHGDLTKRLLMPALYNLAGMNLLDPNLHILGIDHSDNDTAAWITDLTTTMQSFPSEKTGEFHPDSIIAEQWAWITQRLEYVKADFADPAAFTALAAKIPGNALFYLAVAARFFGPVTEQLATAHLLAETPTAFRRVLIEKPFGHDLPSAEALNSELLKLIPETQIYRIDHFMGKEAVQNILPFRFCNPFLEPIWRREFIDYVEITASETVGVERRGAFYEQTGALRDMVPNHLFTILAMTTMEPPAAYNSDAVRSEKARLTAAIQPVRPENIVRGQYQAGTVLGKQDQAYRAEPDVAPTSETETYIALKLDIDNWRWSGVPFYIRTGKAMAGRRTEIIVHFKPQPIALLAPATPATLRITIDPEPAITLDLAVKAPGTLPLLAQAPLQFRYASTFAMPSSVGYEVLFYGALTGDTVLFQRADAIEAAWAAIQPAIDHPPALDFYPAGSPGPASADALLARDGHAWSSLASA